MRKVTLKTIGIALSVLFATIAFGQWKPIGNTTTDGSGFSATDNIVGTQVGTNIPIRFQTNGLNRLKLNHSVSYDINGASGTNLSREGYLLLGKNNNFSSTANPIYKEGAFSLLHLNGYNGNTIDELGYRNWMQTGITFTGNRDLLRYRSVS